MNLDLETADRKVFNTVDWIKELGGFIKGLKIFSLLFLVVLTSRNHETYMISHLYSGQENGQNRSINSEDKTRVTPLQ